MLAGQIDFRRVAIPQTIGFTVWILWVLAASLLILALGGPPPVVGWIGVGAVAVGLAVLGWFARDPAPIRGERNPGRVESMVALLPFLGISVWLIALGLSG